LYTNVYFFNYGRLGIQLLEDASGVIREDLHHPSRLVLASKTAIHAHKGERRGPLLPPGKTVDQLNKRLSWPYVKSW